MKRLAFSVKVAIAAALIFAFVPATPSTSASKMAPNLQKPHEPGELLVRFSSNVSDGQVRQFCSARGIAVLANLQNGIYHIAFSMTQPIADIIAELGGRAEVSYAEPNYIMFATGMPNDPDFSKLYAMHNTGQTGGTLDADVDAAEAWDIRSDASNVVVGIIDTGVDYTHADLAANMWKNTGEVPANGVDDDANGFVDDVYGYDFVNKDGDPMDDQYHGTHVAGTIGAVGNNGLGVTGVAWKAKLMALKFLDASGSGTVADAVSALNYATQMGAKITNNSWGGGGYSQAMKDAIDAAAAKNCLFIAAAGNSGANNDSALFYPASYTSGNVIAVAATDSKDGMASFSNYGSTTVDLGAPGVSIYSTKPGNAYQSLNGTSMATPHVAGATAILWAQDTAQTYGQVRDKLLQGVDAVASLSGKTVTGGRLNLHKSLKVVSETVPPAAVSDLKVDGTELDALTLAWTATGDDGNTGVAKAYDIRYSASPIDAANFASATKVSGVADPKSAGSAEKTLLGGLKENTTYYAAMKVSDAAGNVSALSNVASGKTQSSSVYYQDTLENGVSGWTATGLWHLSSLRANSPMNSFYYGSESKKNYDTGAANSGALISPKVDLTKVSKAVLEFSSWRQVESYDGAFDKTFVDISTDGGATWSQLWYQDSKTASKAAWETINGISLAAYVGKEVMLRFTFNSVDKISNAYEGWYIDDIRILTNAVAPVAPPAAPAALTIADPGDGSTLQLQWAANAEIGLPGYNVYRDAVKVNTALVSGTSYTDSGLTKGLAYTYTIKAQDALGNESAFSASVIGVPGAPQPPAGLNTSVASNTVNLTWSANGEADFAGYHVHRDGAKISSALLTSTSYQDSNLANGTSYAYQLVAVDTFGNTSALSAAVTAKPVSGVAPASPTGLTLSDPGSGSTLNLSWGANTEANLTGYNIYRDGTKANSSLIASTSYTDSGLTLGGNYSYVVKAVNNEGLESGASNAVAGVPGAPASPSLSSISGSDSSANLVWGANSEADLAGYNIYRDGAKINGAVVVATSYKDSALINGNSYSYQISAVDTFSNESAKGNTMSVIPKDSTAPAAPTGLTLTDPGTGNTLNLSWKANSEADFAGYNVYRNGTKLNTALIAALDFTDTGLAQGSNYSYFLKAQDKSGNESAPSSVATAAPGAPTAPVQLAPSGGNACAMIQWAANSENDVQGYSVYQVIVTTTQVSAPTKSKLGGGGGGGGGTTTTVSYQKVNASLVSSTSLYVSNLENGQAYTFVVTATDGSGWESARSNSQSVTPNPKAISPALGLKVVDPGTGDSLNLAWDSSSTAGIAGYNVYRDNALVNSAPVQATSFQDKNLVKGQLYTYFVKAVATDGTESDATATAKGVPGAPAAPVLNTVTGSDAAADLAWAANAEADLAGYNVYRSGVKVNGAIITATAFKDSGLKNGTSYSYQVSAVDTFNNESSLSNTLSVTPKDSLAPAAVTGVALLDPGLGTSLAISWNANTEADLVGYNVYRNGVKVNSAIVSGLNYTDSGLTQGASYTYVVTAQDSSGNESAASASVIGLPGAPAIPVALVAVAGDAAINLSWGANTEADLGGYNLYRSGVKINAAVLTGTSFKDSGLKNGTAYSYQISAVDTFNNESAKSGVVNATPKDATAPVIPTGLKVNDPGDGATLNLSWNANSDSDLAGYNVYRDGIKVNGALVSGTSYTDSGMLKGLSYGFTVKAVDSSGNESAASASVMGVPGAPKAPTGLAANAASKTVSLTWNPNGEADLAGYNVYRDGVKINGSILATADYKDKNLVNGTTYAYQVSALDSFGNESALATAVNAKPLPGLPPGAVKGPKLTDAGDGSTLNLSWTANSEADLAGYNLYRNNSKINSATITATNFTDTGLTKASTYNYAVKAINADGVEGSESASVTGVPGAPATPALSSVVGSDGAADFAWVANSEADLAGYNIYRDGAKINGSVVNGTSYKDSGLKNGNSYSYQISAVDTFNNESSKSSAMSVTPKDSVAPSAPAGVTLNDPGTGSMLNVSWSASSAADLAGYNVYRNGNKVNATLLTAVSCIDSGLSGGASYSYVIKAQDTSGNESAASASVTGIPGAPMTPASPGVAADDSAADLSWSANAEADLAGYNVYRNGAKINGSVISGVSYKDSGLNNGTSYSYQISAVDAFNNESGKSSAMSVTPKDSMAPSAPAGVTLNDPGTGSTLNVNWSASSAVDLAGYNVYRNGSKINAALVTAISYPDSGLAKGANYSYIIKAQDTSGNESVASASVAGIPGAPVIPSGINAVASDGIADLQWTANTEADLAGYNIYRDGVKINGAVINGVSYKDSSLNNGTSYGYQISAVDAFNNESDKSSAMSVIPKDSLAPLAPTGVALNDTGTGNALNVSWSASSAKDLAGYNVYRNGAKINTALLTTTSCADVGLASGSNYAYTITAVDTSGNESALSEVVGAAPGAPFIPTLLHANAGDGNIALSWSTNTESDLAGYDVYEKTSVFVPAPVKKSKLGGDGGTASGGTTVISYQKRNTTTLTSPAYSISGLENGKSYTFAVLAKDISGNQSAYSNELSAMPMVTSSGASAAQNAPSFIPSFRDATKFLLEDGAGLHTAIASGDINADGRMDMFICDDKKGGRLVLGKAKNKPSDLGLEDATSAWMGDNPGKVSDSIFTDIDHDGALDLILVKKAIQIYRNNQQGQFVEESAVRMPGFAGDATCVAAGDIDADGVHDLAVGFEDRLEIWQNNTGNLTRSAVLRSATSPLGDVQAGACQMIFLDINNDGRSDIVVAGNPTPIWINAGHGAFMEDTGRLQNVGASKKVVAMRGTKKNADLLFVGSDGRLSLQGNNGNGFFTDETSARGLSPVAGARCAVAGDINGDAMPDVIVGGDGFAQVFMNAGNDTFQDQTDVLFTGSRLGTINDMVLIDIDGDGDLDLACANGKEEQDQYDAVYVNEGNGKLTYDFNALLHLERGADSIGMGRAETKVGDLNNDGSPEIVRVLGQALGIYARDNAGVWNLHHKVAVGTQVLALSLEDMDKDGDLDLLVKVEGSSNRVLMNKGNGYYSAAEAGRLGELTGPANALSLDMNGDGMQDVMKVSTSGVSVFANAGEDTFVDKTSEWTSLSRKHGYSACYLLYKKGEKQAMLLPPSENDPFPDTVLASGPLD